MVKGKESGARPLGLRKSCLCHLLAVWPRANYLTSLCYILLICNVDNNNIYLTGWSHYCCINELILIKYLECCLEYSKSHSNVCQDYYVNIHLINIYSAPTASQAAWATWEHNGLQALLLCHSSGQGNIIAAISSANPNSWVNPLSAHTAPEGSF